MKKLDNAVLLKNVKSIETVDQSFKEEIYEVIKKIIVLVNSNNFRGSGAESAKQYLSDVTTNIYVGCINIAEEMTEAINDYSQSFLDFENNKRGIISSDALDYSKKTTNNPHKKNYESLMDIVDGHLGIAAKYVRTKDVKRSLVTDSFIATCDELDTIYDDFDTADKNAIDVLADIKAHVSSLIKMADSLKTVVSAKGNVEYSKVHGITSNDSFIKEDLSRYEQMQRDDPFSYYAGTANVWEKRGGRGVLEDVYVEGGAEFLTASGSVRRSKRAILTEGRADFFRADGSFQATKYLNGDGYVSVVGAEGKAEIGLGHDIYGVNLEGEAAVFRANGKVKLGPEKCNAYVDAEAKVLSAEGYAKAYYKPGDELEIGLGGDLTAASASVSVGNDLLSARVKDDKGGEKEETLLSFRATAEASAGVSGGAKLGMKEVVDTKYLDVHVVSFKAKAVFGIGGSIDIKFPIVWFW